MRLIMLRLLLWGTLNFVLCTIATAQRPNILFVISDDQSYPHASAYGSRMVATPGFDFVAKQGALFTKA